MYNSGLEYFTHLILISDSKRGRNSHHSGREYRTYLDYEVNIKLELYSRSQWYQGIIVQMGL